MERISYYKGNRAQNIFLISIGILALFIGIAGIFGKVFSINWLNEDFGTLNIISFLSLGALYLFLYFTINKRRQKFIKWDNKLIRYRLPGTKVTELIKVDDIEKVKIEIFGISLQLKDLSSRQINLEGLDFKDIKLVKAFFSKFE
ncbi:MAG: hypothetical protein QNK30_16055 [Bacteroidales bacterium]|nr:hypothetical protein [Bacteroidales bacterium]